ASASPVPVLQRLDTATAAVEVFVEGLDLEHELRAMTAEKRAIRDNKNLDPADKLHEWLVKDDAHARVQEAARWRKKKKATAPDVSGRVPKHDHSNEDPGGKVSHDLDKNAAAAS